MDRPVGNQTLWVYFSKNQQDEYQLLINGPLTEECKRQIAIELNALIALIIENDQFPVSDLIN